jgi:hypothetical protein
MDYWAISHGARFLMNLRTLLAAWAAALVFSASTAPAFALCAICNASVRFNTELAACFSSRVDGELERLKSEGRGFVIVNLSDCDAVGRGGLPTAAAGGRAVLPLDSSFVADDEALTCLRDAIVANATALDPSFLFDLTRLCP